MGPGGQRLGAGGRLVRAQARLLGWRRRGERLGCGAGLGAAARPRAAAGLSGEGERRVNGPRGKKAMWADNKEGGDDHFHFLFSKQIFPKAFSNNF